ncbi:MAG: helix-turn-helix domain-containing protein [Candidatus Limimorpha sp.]
MSIFEVVKNGSIMDNKNIENYKLKLVDKFVRYTDTNIFLTGKAGTGKTTFLRNIAETSYKRHIIVAPTGVAAINAGGTTIHSFFQLPFGPQIPEEALSGAGADIRSRSAQYQKISSIKLKIMRSIDLLIIDEISMVRADLLDAIDSVMRRVRRSQKPFGGVQILMIGDIHQLAPVAKNDEWEILQPYYKSVYFFDSHVLQRTPHLCIELDHIYRQNDSTFINILNKVRNNNIDRETLDILNKRYQPDFEPSDDEGYITLMTHNRQVDSVNDSKLAELKSAPMTFEAKTEGIFPEISFPTKSSLELKVGAQVMFVKNDPSAEKLYYNGRIGTIIDYDENEGIKVKSDDDIINVTPVTWQNFEYSINEETKEIEEKEIGSFTQIPLKLAWAITIHKSQGLTFKKVILDASLAFAHGQIYVALSRCTSLQGLVLKSKISPTGFFNDPSINNFIDVIPEREPNEEQFDYYKKHYQSEMVFELFDFTDIFSDLQKVSQLLFTHKNIIESETAEKCSALNKFFFDEVIEVSKRFKRQITNILSANFAIDGNQQLQERIIKGCHYFLEKTSAVNELFDMPVDTDNKSVNNLIKNALDLLKEDIFIKKACLECCGDGFEMNKYLETKNKKTVEAEGLKKKTPSKLKKKTVEGKDKALYYELLRWREDVADALDIKEAQVIPTTTLIAIAQKKPMSVKELKSISKVGSTRIQRFGADILNIILEYQGFKKKEFDDKESKEELELSATIKRTKELLEEGLDIEMIAERRGMAKSTVQSHLAELVLKGYANAKDYVKPEHYDTITEYFTETQDASLGAARDVLGEEYDWNELRIVLNELKRLNEI